ncbi:uncharacterized protein METZ01_LOCUS397419 [marine metagenome]|uniref:Uncharacterized protein n=1 Tax=marine metagenome TaxID=408172 RepID=A0A382VEV6_9ZZZZ
MKRSIIVGTASEINLDISVLTIWMF